MVMTYNVGFFSITLISFLYLRSVNAFYSHCLVTRLRGGVLPAKKHTGIVCFCHSTKFRENTLTPLFSLCKSQCTIHFSITFSVNNLYVTLFPLWPTFHLPHSFSDTPSFICTAAVRPDHLQGAYCRLTSFQPSPETHSMVFVPCK